MTTDSHKIRKIPSSFRDPSGFVFIHKDKIYRRINQIYKKNYELLSSSNLLNLLFDKNFLIEHKEVDLPCDNDENFYKTIAPQNIPFISYPYEWCFSELKDAALLTLEIQNLALAYGMSLKDASAYNIQFIEGKPILIDTLSFEKYNPDKPWIAYKQFCQHFLAPLLLLSNTDKRLNYLSRIFIDGIPLDLTSSLLPGLSYFNLGTLVHIHLHAKSQKIFAGKQVKKDSFKSSKNSQLALIDNLKSQIQKLTIAKKETEWGEYYSNTNYTGEAFEEKKKNILNFIKIIKPKTLWDFGANTGLFSRIASDQLIKTVSFDIDPIAVEKNYLEIKKKKEKNILPLILDLTNPSPSIGWAHKERISLASRGPVDVLMALALIHHLAISNNLPFNQIAEYFSQISQYLIIEFIPKNDSNAQKLLASREDIFHDYTQDKFENAFKKYYNITNRSEIKNSNRTLYLMKKR